MDNSTGDEGRGDYPYWTPPRIDVSVGPSLKSTRFPCGVRPQGPPVQSNFYREAKWCPDGTCAMTLLEDRTMEIVSIPTEDATSLSSRLLQPLQASAVLDFQWYPAASSYLPAYFCYVVSVRDCPIKLVNASDGSLRASYSIVDHRERHVAPHSLVFDPSATRLFCGFENTIEIFDFNSPGSDALRLPLTPSKKSKTGLKGIISSLSFSPDIASGIYAAGSFNGTAALFSTDGGSAMIGKLRGVRGAVSQVRFHPTIPEVVFAASRRSDCIQSWDIRNPRYVLKEYARKGRHTNQRMGFDIDFGGRWMASGDEDGCISLFDVGDSGEVGAALSWEGHQDAVGSVGFSPTNPYLLSVSGSRHFGSPEQSGESGEESDDGMDYCGENPRLTPSTIHRQRTRRLPEVNDASMKLWSFGNTREEINEADATTGLSCPSDGLPS